MAGPRARETSLSSSYHGSRRHLRVGNTSEIVVLLDSFSLKHVLAVPVASAFSSENLPLKDAFDCPYPIFAPLLVVFHRITSDWRCSGLIGWHETLEVKMLSFILCQ